MTLLSTSPQGVRFFEDAYLSSSSSSSKPPSCKIRESDNEKDHNDDMLITSLNDLIDALPQAIADRKEWKIPPGAPNDPISILFRRTQLGPAEWKPYAHFDASRPYTRNLIATDDASYTLLLLCWNPGQESPIHNHPCDGCWMQVLQGTVQECRYTYAPNDTNESLMCTSNQIFGHGQLAYITDHMGVHKVGNPSPNQPSVTVHLYSPPFGSCRTWAHPLATPSICTSSNCHYSEYGQVVVGVVDDDKNQEES